MNTTAYKCNADTVIERLRLLYERQAQDQIFAAFEIPGITLSEFQKQHSEGLCDYPDPCVRIDFWDKLLKEKTSIEDDSIPSAYLSEFDQGLYAGLHSRSTPGNEPSEKLISTTWRIPQTVFVLRWTFPHRWRA
ncbi:hypothetical protein AUJ66_08860 [Candidatus Desantisbacteria bacterium CG1_02_38_46]|uniref:Uncharacterized protein n=3 Tax=unclassified Candidatus Desantisiibacteriota TaxID=3106372 RepID=A0A2H9PB71_9BACT|nr:MAG: hypothetical protein AUJ66_08860 [Candidatus Desantisbacteria bacterium CG1_02_38_46]PIU51657.1 MAG: hypothetical protein COS91_03290 [Candidatus Desantisbacteria bacterium CG07_land_8_20_14_0_80_39_15]PIZ15969.1 MAG: hypothetical protein COY51_03830 [Candidatus Desantisbacteria bacterium CG_4_10_14_0_8_um_filter_39_17]